ncbi:class I SAM-dependent methyltransferase, partial [Microbacterium sp.]|uniref:O-methyltransferase n=1 Tax=Microbacterium sp. TaxID=51671 RepID=UPI002811FD32
MSEHDAIARFARETVVEPEHIAKARQHALELGAGPISAGVGAQCAVIAAATDARSIIEIGTGAGVSGLWLLRGAPKAVLTTIDNEPEHLAAARQAFTQSRIPSSRVRLITGRAADVLPRMNEASYDIVLVDADPENTLEYVEHALRLARAGGTVLVPRVLNGRVADPV